MTTIIIIVLAAYIVIAVFRTRLLHEVLNSLHLENINKILTKCDDKVVVKSRQALSNYSDLKYFKDNDCFEQVKSISDEKLFIQNKLISFLQDNDFKTRKLYKYIEKRLNKYIKLADGYCVQVTYITSAGNNKGQRTIFIPNSRIKEIYNHPEYLMTKGEFNKFKKQKDKEKLENKKHSFYDKVNSIIDFANNSKDELIVKSKARMLDDLVQRLFDRTINNIQKIKKLDSDEWNMFNNFIADIDSQVRKIVEDDKRISDYYASEDFAKIKETCNLLTQSRKEFNEYIDEKAQSISQLFGTRVVRNETKNEDTYNYVRAYKKSITPFTAEVSSSVFSSAENNPMGYIIKYFYPNKSQYKEQIHKLKLLIEELETLKEAKVIIDNYKKDYAQYIQDVPKFIIENDEDGFYSRLGLTIVDEAILNVEYKFTYTSNGGMAQRSFTVPMNEENIIELIHGLESKLTKAALAKEQRAMMTTKLRNHIKERDNYTCCNCGNSTHKEPNLLLEIDHIIPVSKGGLTQENNLQTLCWKCNRSKGSKLI